MNQVLNTALKKARAVYIAGDAKSAIQQCQKIAKRYSKNAEPYLLMATIHQSQGRLSMAIESLATAHKKSRDNVSIILQYGDACMQAGKYITAAKLYALGARSQPQQSAWKLRMAAALQESQSTVAEAQLIYQQLIEHNPNDAALHYNLGTCFKRQHKFEQTIDCYRQAVSLAPEDIHYRIRLCNMLFEMTEFDLAAQEGERILDIQSDVAEVIDILYYCYKKLSVFDKSLHYAQRLIDVDGQSANNMSALASAQIADQQYSEALKTCDVALKRYPTNRRILADKTIALSFMDCKAQAKTIFDVECLLNISHLEAPPGYSTIEAFNDAIVQHVINHSAIRFDGLNHTCLGGTTSNEVFVDPLGPIEQLKKAILAAVNTYRKSLPTNHDHLWLSHLPDQDQLNLSGWVTRLKTQGYQQGHIHPTAWISGVYYLSLPPIDPQQPEAGGIEFGRSPSYYPEGGDQGDKKLIRPTAGTLVLFPSYFYHRTIPFDADEQRVTLAFDCRTSDFS